MKKKWTAILLLLLIIMMLTPMALAGDRSDVIPWLYYQDPDSAEALRAETLVQPIDYEYNGDVSFIVKDAYFDGETLAIAIQFKTDRPLYLINEDAKLDGEWIDYHTCGTSLEETFVGHAASPQRFSPIEDVRAFYYELSRPLPKGEEVDVTINFTMCAFTKDCARHLRIMGTAGEIVADMQQNTIDVLPFVGENEHIDVATLTSDFSGHGGGDARLLEDFLDLVQQTGRSKALTSITHSVESHLAALAAEESRLNAGRVVELNQL